MLVRADGEKDNLAGMFADGVPQEWHGLPLWKTALVLPPRQAAA